MTPEIMKAAEGGGVDDREAEAAWSVLVPHLERQRRAERAGARDSEAALERRVLLRIGELQRARPTLLAFRNEVGVGFQASAMGAVARALAPFGPDAVAVALGVLKRHRVAFGVPGSPDLWVYPDGRAAGLELKRAEGGVVSTVQKQFHAAARRRGVFVGVVTHEDQVAGALERCRRGEVE